MYNTEEKIFIILFLIQKMSIITSIVFAIYISLKFFAIVTYKIHKKKNYKKQEKIKKKKRKKSKNERHGIQP